MIFIQIFLLLFSISIYGNKTTLTIYTYDNFASNLGPGPIIKKNFEKKYNCHIKFIILKDSISILNRLRIEGRNTLADIVIGLNSNIITEVKKINLFSKTNIDINSINLPITWDDDTFIPYDYSFFSFIYNTKKIKKPPKNFDELLNNNTSWKIVYPDPRTSTLGLGFLLWIEKLYKNSSELIWKKLSKKTLTITKGWSEAYALFLKGEADFMLSYTTSLAYFLSKNKNINYNNIDLPEGYYLQIEIIAKLITSKYPELTEKFIEFILTQESQKIILNNNWMYPVMLIKFPTYFKYITYPNIILRQFSSEEILKNKKIWINKWKNAIIQ